MIRPNGREPCRDLSLARDEALTATASPTRRWLLVEQDGAWGRDAATESKLDVEVGAAVKSTLSANHGRLLLVREPPARRRDRTRGSRRWFAYDADWSERRLRHGTFDADHELLPLAASLLGDEPFDEGRSYDRDLLLVCTHGKHDPCCAESGRDACRAFVELGADDLLECSHIGGDRFAGNALLLPFGLYFGRVDGASAARFDAARRERRILLEHYRGRATVSQFAQVAEHHVRRLTGLDGFDDVVPVEDESADQHDHRITVRAGTERFVVAVERTGHDQPAFLTCQAEKEGRPPIYSARTVTP